MRYSLLFYGNIYQVLHWSRKTNDIVVLFEFVHLFGLILLAREILGSQSKTKQK